MPDYIPDPADVELVRNAWRNAPCSTCGRQRACRCIIEDHELRDYRARAVLSALAAAGRLRQEDDMSKEIRVELNGESHVTKTRETMPDDEKRVVLIKPGDVLLIGGVRFSDAYQEVKPEKADEIDDTIRAYTRTTSTSTFTTPWTVGGATRRSRPVPPETT